MHKLPQPVKLWCWGPFFRHERPQAGRFRQFHQFDAEAIGTDSPLADAESIILLDEILRTLAVPGLRLRLGSLGSLESRAAYRDELRGYLHAHEAELARRGARRGSTPTRCARSTPTTRGRGGDGGRADDARPPRATTTPSTSTRCKRLLDQRRRRLRARRHPGPRARLLHAHGLRVHVRRARRAVGAGRRRPLRRPGRGARRAADAGGRLGRRGSSGSCWRSASRRRRPALDVFVVAADGQRERPWRATTELRRAGVCADLDLADRSHQGPDEAGRSLAAPPRAVILDEDGAARLRDMDERRAARPRPGDAAAEIERERA